MRTLTELQRLLEGKKVVRVEGIMRARRVCAAIRLQLDSGQEIVFNVPVYLDQAMERSGLEAERGSAH